MNHSADFEYDKSEGRALRLLEIYFYIEEHPGVKSELLAEHFGISQATFFRDINSLRKMGILITQETPNRGGYHIEKGSIRFARVQKNELKPLLIAEHLLEKLAFPDGDIFHRLVHQMMGTLRPEDIARVEGHLSKFIYFRTPLNRRFNSQSTKYVEFLTGLLAACENQWSVQLTYDHDGERTERVVNPLGLWFGQSAWYLGAWCQKRNDYRTFAIDRMDEVKVLPHKTYVYPKGFNLAQWVETSWIAMPTREAEDMVWVTVEFDRRLGETISKAYWHESQEFILPGEDADPNTPVLAKFYLSKTSAETEFQSWVDSFGGKARMVSN